MKYLVLHRHPEGLVMAPKQRDLLFATGRVVDVIECREEHLTEYWFRKLEQVRPLAVVLWGLDDAEGVGTKLGVESLTARDWYEAHLLCQEKRPVLRRWTDEDGTPREALGWEVPRPVFLATQVVGQPGCACEGGQS